MQYFVEFYNKSGGKIMHCFRTSAQDALLEVASNYDNDFWSATCYHVSAECPVVWEFERKLRKVG